MNHMKSIKEMLSIPTGSSNRNVGSSGYSSYTDSQLFFGSQFWPDNSQGMSQDMSLSSRTSQQSSQEGSDSKFSSNYHTKPFLFGEKKDRSKGLGMLDKFEEDKKKAKEKAAVDVLAKELNHFQETLNNIQQLVAGTERKTDVCQTVLKNFDNFASTLQDNLNGLQGHISQQFETLLNKINSQNEMMRELEQKVQKSGDTTDLQSLKSSLECLREEQERERNTLEEAMKLLSTLVSKHSAKPSPVRVTESAIQTSPWPKQPFANILQDSKLECTEPAHKSQNLEHIQAKVHPRDLGFYKAKSFQKRGKKRPLVISQRRKCTVMDENTQPLMNCDRPQNGSTPLCERHDPDQNSLIPDCVPERKITSIAKGCIITPLTCWSQDSNNSFCLDAIEPMLEKFSAESLRATPVKPESLWQLFDKEKDWM